MGARLVRERVPTGWDVGLAREGGDEALKGPWGFRGVSLQWGLRIRSRRWELVPIFGDVNLDSVVRLNRVIYVSATCPPP